MLKKLQHFYENYCESIRKEADAMREEALPVITEELFAIYENTGNRLTYEAVYFRKRKFLAVFGLKAILDREDRDIEKLEEILQDICSEECWALPAHVNRKADENWRTCVDLFASETAQTLSEITFLLQDVLSVQVKERVRQEVMRRVIGPFSASDPSDGFWWERGESNWCAVCGGSIGSAAIYLLQDQPEALDALLDRICDSLETYYLKSFAEDGTCLEGLGYFTYGMTYFVGFAEQLYAYTEGKRDLFRNEKLAKIAAFQAKCYFQSGKTVSFADGFTDDTFRPGLACFLAEKYPEAEIPAMERAAGLNDDNCYRWMGLYRNLTWTEAYMDALRQGRITGTDERRGFEAAAGTGEICEGKVTAGVKSGKSGELPEMQADVDARKGMQADVSVRKETQTDVGAWKGMQADDGARKEIQTAATDRKASGIGQVVLPNAQWSIYQSRNGAGMAAKGGHNGEPHNHNDVGSFFYLKGKDFFLADLGCGEYTRDYFSEKRYEDLCCRSLGHNVPLIDGREQLAGEEYGCDRFETDGRGRTWISFAGTYANPELKSLIRLLDWNAENGTLQVEDRFQVTEKLQSIRENLITGWKPQIQNNTIQLQGSREGCVIEIKGEDVEVECIHRNFNDHNGVLRDVWLLQWEVPIGGTREEITVRFSVSTLQP